MSWFNGHAFRLGLPERVAKVQLLLPHASITTERSELLETGLNQAGRILKQVVLYHEARAAWGEAEPLYQRAIAILEAGLPPHHPEIAAVRDNYARLLASHGRADQSAARTA